MMGMMRINQAHFKHMPAKTQNSKDFKKAQGIVNPLGPRLLTLKDASRWLGLTIWGMRERVWAGLIPVVRFPGGRKMYVDTKDLEAFIVQNKERM